MSNDMRNLIYTMLFLLAGLAGMAQEKTQQEPFSIPIDSLKPVTSYGWGNAVCWGRIPSKAVDVNVAIQWSPETGRIRFKSGDGWTDWYKLVKAENGSITPGRMSAPDGNVPISSRGVYWLKPNENNEK